MDSSQVWKTVIMAPTGSSSGGSSERSTVAAAFMGLLPIMWSTAAGSDLMKRIAAPMVGGLVTSFLLELLVYPAIYYLWRRREVVEGPAGPGWTLAAARGRE